ncbi:HTH domain-containing protein [Haloferax sp. MBLA0076]|uniref:HTH domain-containing protein n=1 Tax=Haloferax litoreum TaxID=2666140 RepID=A0A6A8GDM3_9EURY|nr:MULTISPECIES: HTH domain-containing protein [Haloferax]KAB1194782.1 helix-turn-helix transcriptional regulator [Haloferax sp. CBA1148]MRX20896.1 HTH domain-containing protein [Haloferax litoreum]
MENGPGRPPTVSDDQILDVFKSSADPVLTASELADELDIGRRGVLARLETLEERGYLRSKKVGGRSTVWWYPGYSSTTPVDPDQ